MTRTCCGLFVAIGACSFPKRVLFFRGFIWNRRKRSVEGEAVQLLRCREAFTGATWSVLLLTYVRATVRERMHVGALCLLLIDLALHHPLHTLFGTGSCRSVFGLAIPARARSFDQGWSHRKPGVLSKSQCPHPPGLRVVNQAFALFG